MTTSEKLIRVGVVGAGHLGNYHLQKYAKIAACKIVAVADTQADKAVRAAEPYGSETVTDHRQMLDKVDAVSIAVPTAFHHPVARDFLAAGIDVLWKAFRIRRGRLLGG